MFEFIGMIVVAVIVWQGVQYHIVFAYQYHDWLISANTDYCIITKLRKSKNANNIYIISIIYFGFKEDK